MEKRQVYAATGLLGVALLLPGCGNNQAPIQPTTPTTSTSQAFSLHGGVTDTAYRPLGAAIVAVTNGPRAGTVATTDQSGRFSMPGIFTGTITVTASKDGYVPITRTVPPDRPYALPLTEEVGRWEIAVSLEPVGPSANIVGEYTVTLTTDSSCTSLPAEARTRTYVATIVPGGRSSSFLVRLSGARFFSTVPCPAGQLPESCTYSQFGMGIAGDYAGIGVVIVEQLSETTYLVVEAGAEGPLGPNGITAPLDGRFEYCPKEPALIDQGTWACLVGAGTQCESRNHQVTLRRR